MEQLLISAAVLALAGSIHCVGMCGGFVLAIAQATDQRRAVLGRQLLYHLGKTSTYAMLGLVAGGLGSAIITMFSGAQRTLSVVLGIALILVGLGLLGLVRRLDLGSFAPLRKMLGKISRKMGGLIRGGDKKALYALGMLNGILPCGLVYGALALAVASGSALHGALVMGVFGAATMPALLILASVGALINPLWRSRLSIASGVVIVVLGMITIARGIGGPHGGHQNHAMPATMEQHHH